MIWIEVIIIFALSAWLTMAEMATFSARPERMRQAAASGDKRGTHVLAYQRSPVSFIAAGQVLATAGSLVIGALMQSWATPAITAFLDPYFDLPQDQLSGISSTIALVLFTILALIATNVVPKQIGFDHADKIAIAVANPFRFLIRITRPIAWLVTIVSRAAESFVNRRVTAGHRVTEADLLTLMAEGMRLGTLNETESTFVKNALHLSDVSVKNICSPIAKADYILTNQDRATTTAQLIESHHSYLPVFSQFPREPLGILKALDWFYTPEDKRFLPELTQPVIILESTKSAVEIFTALSDVSSRIILVREAGEIIGMVTMNDAIKLLAGNMKALS